MKADSVEEFLGSLQESMGRAWKKHLKTDKYSDHKALNEFYDDIVDLVDTLIEDYQGLHGVVDSLKNVIDSEGMSAVEYLEELRELTLDGRDKFIDDDEPELKSDVDAILSLIDGTLYKLKELKEDNESTNTSTNTSIPSLRDFLYEAIVN